MKSTLVLYRKGLCGFFPVLGFALEEKLCGAKCCKFYEPEGVVLTNYSIPFPPVCHSQMFHVVAVICQLCQLSIESSKMNLFDVDYDDIFALANNP